jgi:hypothetical protein
LKAVLRSSLLIVSAGILAACGKPTLEIQSNTTWSGSITEGSAPSYPISGSGNKSIAISTDESFCWTVQMTTNSGMLHVYARVPGFLTVDHFGDATTFAAFGVLANCSG